MRKAAWYMRDRPSFLMALATDIDRFQVWATRKGLRPVVRLNGTSDIAWERIKLQGRNVFEAFPQVQFYDYTKAPYKVRGRMPINYDLTRSYGGPDTLDSVLVDASIGRRVAVVFGDKVPSRWHNMHTIDGDGDDLRFNDPGSCVVALSAKGPARLDRTSGFVVW